MEKFFNGNVCYSRAMCRACRADTDKGKKFRLSIIKQYGGKDECFECPHKVPWGCGKQPEQKSRGLGDTVEKFTRKTGIKTVVHGINRVTGRPCNCDGRQTDLNKKKPYAN